VHGPDRARHHLHQGRQVIEAVAIHQNFLVPGRQAVAAGARRGGFVLDLQYAGHRLLFQPFADVSLVGARVSGQFFRSNRPVLAQRPVEPQAVAQVNGENVESASGRFEQTLNESISIFLNCIA
jgi:hypothetical protein